MAIDGFTFCQKVLVCQYARNAASQYCLLKRTWRGVEGLASAVIGILVEREGHLINPEILDGTLISR